MKFSVLLPTRNRVELLRYAIGSVRLQDWDDWEIVVSDNDSSEDVSGCVRSFGDERIRCVRTERFVPVTDNWNNALRHARGDYLVMLGDDDALLPGYFSALAEFIGRYGQPQLVYTEADQYAYPDVVPGHPSGFVQRGYTEFLYGGGRSEPFWLDREAARGLVRKSMSFRVAFGFNMQHYLVSRRMVEALSRSGEFYQSPYPDYYAANALLLVAERVLVVPRAMVVIGISPRSFGYYYFNAREEEGDRFLNNVPEPGLRQRLQDVALPGSSMNTSWLYAMELVKRNFDPQGGLRIAYRRYRLLQVYATFARSGFAGVRRLLGRLNAGELAVCALLGLAALLAKRVLPRRLGGALWSWLSARFSPYPPFDLRRREVPYRNILELVEAAQDRKAGTGSVASAA